MIRNRKTRSAASVASIAAMLLVGGLATTRSAMAQNPVIDLCKVYNDGALIVDREASDSPALIEYEAAIPIEEIKNCPILNSLEVRPVGIGAYSLTFNNGALGHPMRGSEFTFGSNVTHFTFNNVTFSSGLTFMGLAVDGSSISITGSAPTTPGVYTSKATISNLYKTNGNTNQQLTFLNFDSAFNFGELDITITNYDITLTLPELPDVPNPDAGEPNEPATVTPEGYSVLISVQSHSSPAPFSAMAAAITNNNITFDSAVKTDGAAVFVFSTPSNTAFRTTITDNVVNYNGDFADNQDSRFLVSIYAGQSSGLPSSPANSALSVTKNTINTAERGVNVVAFAAGSLPIDVSITDNIFNNAANPTLQIGGTLRNVDVADFAFVDPNENFKTSLFDMRFTNCTFARPLRFANAIRRGSVLTITNSTYDYTYSNYVSKKMSVQSVDFGQVFLELSGLEFDNNDNESSPVAFVLSGNTFKMANGPSMGIVRLPNSVTAPIVVNVNNNDITFVSNDDTDDTNHIPLSEAFCVAFRSTDMNAATGFNVKFADNRVTYKGSFAPASACLNFAQEIGDNTPPTLPAGEITDEQTVIVTATGNTFNNVADPLSTKVYAIFKLAFDNNTIKTTNVSITIHNTIVSPVFTISVSGNLIGPTAQAGTIFTQLPPTIAVGSTLAIDGNTLTVGHLSESAPFVFAVTQSTWASVPADGTDFSCSRNSVSSGQMMRTTDKMFEFRNFEESNPDSRRMAAQGPSSSTLNLRLLDNRFRGSIIATLTRFLSVSIFNGGQLPGISFLFPEVTNPPTTTKKKTPAYEEFWQDHPYNPLKSTTPTSAAPTTKKPTTLQPTTTATETEADATETITTTEAPVTTTGHPFMFISAAQPAASSVAAVVVALVAAAALL